MNKYIILSLFCLTSFLVHAQQEFRLLDSGYVGYFDYSLNILDDLDPSNASYLESSRIQKVDAGQLFVYVDSLSCLEYDILDLGNSSESLRSSGKRIRKISICESEDSRVYIMSPQSWDIISKERFAFLQDSLRRDHPQMSLYWDTYQYIPGYIKLDSTNSLSEEIHFMKVNRQPSFTEQYGEDSIMIFGELKPRLMYDFGMEVGDTIKLDYFDDNYWFQDLDTGNDNLELLLKSIYDLSTCSDPISCQGERPFFFSSVGFFYEFEVLYNQKSIQHDIVYPSFTDVGTGDYILPWTVDYVIPSNHGQYFPVCNNIDTISSRRCFVDLSDGGAACSFICNRDSTTNVNDIESKSEEQSIRVFPNPANDQLFISTSSEQRQLIKSVEIYGISGRQFYSHTYNGDSVIGVEVSSLAPGLYILKVRYGDGQISLRKFVKME